MIGILTTASSGFEGFAAPIWRDTSYFDGLTSFQLQTGAVKHRNSRADQRNACACAVEKENGVI